MKLRVLTIALVLLCGCTTMPMRMSSMVLFNQSSSATLSATTCHKDPSGRRVIFVPMVHSGGSDNYREIADFLSVTREDGYTIFFEGVTLINGTDTTNIDTIRRKIRQVMGYNISSVKRTQSNDILGLPSGYNDTVGIYRVDMSFEDIIAQYESEYCPITLTPYDLETPLDAPYSTPTNIQHSPSLFIKEIRDRYIAQRVLESPYQKIVLIYGAAHYSGIFNILKKSGFRHDNSFRARKYVK